MDIVITFFRDIDGWVYYVMLVVNTILIFAIIGYLGEKSNEQLMKLSMNTGIPSNDSNVNNINLNSTKANYSSDLNIPKVTATSARPNGAITQNVPVNQNVVTPVQNSPVNTVPRNVSTIPNVVNAESNDVSSSSSVNDAIPTVEKAPAVLVINSSDSQKDVK